MPVQAGKYELIDETILDTADDILVFSQSLDDDIIKGNSSMGVFGRSDYTRKRHNTAMEPKNQNYFGNLKKMHMETSVLCEYHR